MVEYFLMLIPPIIMNYSITSLQRHFVFVFEIFFVFCHLSLCDILSLIMLILYILRLLQEYKWGQIAELYLHMVI